VRKFVTVPAVLVLVVLMGATACGKSKKSSSTATTAGSSGSKVTVNVDGTSDAFKSAYTAFFPNEVTLHPGDTVDFKENWTGEPHTVTFGTLIDTGLAAADKAGPNATDEPAELKKVPDILPKGPGDAVQTTAQPCFLATGDPPTDGSACPKVSQPDFDGKHTLYNSGFLAPGDPFSVKLAKALAPGTYRYFCVIHREGMEGKITVVPAGEKAQSAAEVATAGKASQAAIDTKLKAVFDTLPTLTAAKAVAGGGSPDAPNGFLTEFGPNSVSVPVGGTVTWDVQGPHTISFNASEDAVGAVAKAPDGTVHLNLKAAAPAGGPGVAPGTPPPTKPIVIDGGKWDGTGFRNSGFLLGFGPPGLLKFTLTFTKAGTYQMRCLIHPDMKGTVKVG